MKRTFTCIVCPNGCEIDAEYEGANVLSVTGNLCPKGRAYVTQELTDPRRTIATSVRVTGGTMPLASVRLTKAIPKLEELHKDGESGRRKIQQWTRMISVPLAVVQSIAFIFILRETVLAGNSVGLGVTTPMEWIIAVTAMTAGSVLLMWLGELITEQGIGNGISMIIFATLGFCSRKISSCVLTILSTAPRASLFPSFCFVCPSN